jgi:dynein heavy chain
MMQVIFQHYARDLDAVQAQYEAQKHNPPVPHNVPPTAGNIMWSRQLLSRIEEPMQLFAQNKNLMAMKEGKKTIKLYNRVSLARLEIGGSWHQHFHCPPFSALPAEPPLVGICTARFAVHCAPPLIIREQR